MPRKLLAGAAIGVNVLAAVATILILLQKSSGGPDLYWYVGWALTPVVAYLLISLGAGRNVFDAGVALASSLAVCGYGAFILYDCLYLHPDAQSGLAVLVLPVAQLWGAGVTVAVIGLAHFLKWLVWPQREASAA